MHFKVQCLVLIMKRYKCLVTKNTTNIKYKLDSKVNHKTNALVAK